MRSAAGTSSRSVLVAMVGTVLTPMPMAAVAAASAPPSSPPDEVPVTSEVPVTTAAPTTELPVTTQAVVTTEAAPTTSLAPTTFGPSTTTPPPATTEAAAAVDTISGTVSSADGTPLAGAIVQLHGDSNFFEADTGADGRFRFVDLPDDAYRVRVETTDGRHVSEWWPDATSADLATAIVIPSAVDVDLPIELAPAPGALLQGTVSAGDGTPIEGIVVRTEDLAALRRDGRRRPLLDARPSRQLQAGVLRPFRRVELGVVGGRGVCLAGDRDRRRRRC